MLKNCHFLKIDEGRKKKAFRSGKMVEDLVRIKNNLRQICCFL